MPARPHRPTLTLAVYQEVLDMGTASAVLEEIMGATLVEACEILCARGAEPGVLGLDWRSSTKCPPGEQVAEG